MSRIIVITSGKGGVGKTTTTSNIGIALAQLGQKLKDSYDFILIDSPAGIDEGFQVAIHAAEEALIVVTPEVTSIRDADKVIGLLEAKDINNINLVINRLKPEMVKAENMMSVNDVKDILGIPLIGVIPDSEQPSD
eukprot:scaffold51549_cov1860-Isochrysis_galbana.AAC.2